MSTFTERVKTEFGDILSESQIKNHLIPVVQEWLMSFRERPLDNKQWGRRTSNDVTIDRLIEEVKL